MPSGGAWTCTFPATRRCYDKQLASQTGTWSILGMIAWFIQSKIQFQKVHDFWYMRKLLFTNHFKMVANHLEFHGWYWFLYQFHPSLSRNLFQLQPLRTRGKRGKPPSPAPSKTWELLSGSLYVKHQPPPPHQSPILMKLLQQGLWDAFDQFDFLFLNTWVTRGVPPSN